MNSYNIYILTFYKRDKPIKLSFRYNLPLTLVLLISGAFSVRRGAIIRYFKGGLAWNC